MKLKLIGLGHVDVNEMCYLEAQKRSQVLLLFVDVVAYDTFFFDLGNYYFMLIASSL